MTDKTVSDGLRAVADLLDAMRADGINPTVEIHIAPTRAEFRQVLDRLGLPLNLKGHNGQGWSRIGGEGIIEGVKVAAWNWLRELAQRKTVTKEVEIFEFAGIELDGPIP